MTADQCQNCGAPLAEDARGGLCSQCLFAAAYALPAADEIDPSASPVNPVAETQPNFGASPALPRRFADFELLKEIARGGMGVVFKARQISLDRIVALKLLLGGALSSPEYVKRFRLEAAAAGGLQHPNIVAIHEVGLHEAQHFIAMDYVDGPNLASVLAHGPLPTRRAVGYLKTVAGAIEYAHSKGILHRDLKPSNILLDANDQPHVTDFGLAKRLESDVDLTLTGQVLGSPSYMPPEQAAGQRANLNRTADVYSLGAILYHLLTGRPPFQTAALATTLEQVRTTEPVTPRRLNASVPRDLETICLKCLEKDQARRYPSAQALADELDRFLKAEPIQARPIGALGRTWRWCRRRPAVAGLSVAVGLLVMLLALGSIIAALRFRQEAQRTSEALRQAYLNEAESRLGSGQVGQRFGTLETLAKAAAIRSSIQLRNEAIKALALPDLLEQQRVECPTGALVRFDPTVTLYARRDRLDSRELSIRRVADNREVVRVPSPGPLRQFQLAQDGRFLVTTPPPQGNNEVYQVWDVAKGTMIFQTNVAPRARPVEIRSDGVAAFGLPNGEVLLYDLNQREPVDSYPVGFPANVLRFDPRNRYLAVAAFGRPELLVLDLRQGGRILARLRPPGTVAGGLDWSSDGRLLAAGVSEADQKPVVQVWEWVDGEPREGQILRGGRELITDLSFVPNSEFIVTTSWGGNPQFWSAESGEQVLLAHLTLLIPDLCSNLLAFQLARTQCSIQEFVAGREFRTFYSQPGNGVFGGMDISPDGSLLALGASDGVRLWHIASRTLLAVVPGPAGTVRFHPLDGSLIMVGDDQVVRRSVHQSPSGDEVWIGAPELLSSGRRQQENNFPLALSRDGLKLACAAGEQVEIINWRDPSRRVVLNHGARVKHVSLSSNGALAVTAGVGFKIWDVQQRRPIFQSDLVGYPFSSFSPDDRWLVLSTRGKGNGVGGGSHRIYRVKGWQLVKEVLLDYGPWTPSAFAPDGRLLALRATESAIRLLETGTWTEIATLEAPTQDPFSWFTFSHDSTVLAVACDRHMAQLWDLRALREQLARIGLDWNLPSYPPRQTASTPPPRVVVNSQSAKLKPARLTK